MQTTHTRKRKLIKPGLQLRLIATFFGVGLAALLSQSLLVSWKLSELAVEMPVGDQHVRAALPGIILEILTISVLVLLPLALVFGVLATFRTAGPIYRFETYLGEVARGEAQGPCRIRKGDELQELCERINAALEAVREGRSDPHQEHDQAA